VDQAIVDQAAIAIEPVLDPQDSVVEHSTPPPPPATSRSPPKGKRGKSIHNLETDLRRSERVHSMHKGFKSPVCNDRNYLGCSPNPLVLSPSIVCDLGMTFYNIDPTNLTYESLNAKKLKQSVVGKPTNKKTKLTTESGSGLPEKPKSPSKKPKKSSKDDGKKSNKDVGTSKKGKDPSSGVGPSQDA